jgi:hypothetical protein
MSNSIDKNQPSLEDRLAIQMEKLAAAVAAQQGRLAWRLRLAKSSS